MGGFYISIVVTVITGLSQEFLVHFTDSIVNEHVCDDGEYDARVETLVLV